MQDVFGQLAAVSAVLGGFVITFLAVFATVLEKTRRVGFALSVAVAASGSLILAALGWALLAAQKAKIAASTGPDLAAATEQYAQAMPLLGRISAFFLAGILLLIVLLSASGWLHSRRVGILTLVLGIVFAANVVGIVAPFIVQVR